jgi:hypothetical protein
MMTTRMNNTWRVDTPAKKMDAKRDLAKLAQPASEAALRAEICKSLRQMGWKAIDTSQDTPARGGMKGFPDIIAFKRGRTVLIETKHGKNQLNDSQEEFRADIAQHVDPRTLTYCVARTLDDVLRALGLAV